MNDCIVFVSLFYRNKMGVEAAGFKRFDKVELYIICENSCLIAKKVILLTNNLITNLQRSVEEMQFAQSEQYNKYSSSAVGVFI